MCACGREREVLVRHQLWSGGCLVMEMEPSWAQVNACIYFRIGHSPTSSSASQVLFLNQCPGLATWPSH